MSSRRRRDITIKPCLPDIGGTSSIKHLIPKQEALHQKAIQLFISIINISGIKRIIVN